MSNIYTVKHNCQCDARHDILVTSLKMLQSDWLLKCKEIMTLPYFLTLDTQQSKRRKFNNGLRIVVRNGQ